MTDTQIDLPSVRAQAEQLLQGITPGPWQSEIPGRNDGHMCRITTAWADRGGFLGLGETWNPNHGVSWVGLSRAECIANARLMAAAPTIIRQLLDLLSQLTAREPQVFEAGYLAAKTDGVTGEDEVSKWWREQFKAKAVEAYAAFTRSPSSPPSGDQS